MKFLSTQAWLFTPLAGLFIVLFFAGKLHAQQQSQINNLLPRPLPPNHPDAQLDPSLLNVPPMPEPQQDSHRIFRTEVPNEEIGYDIDTNSIHINPIQSIQHPSSPRVSPPNFGIDGNVE
ncbi:hypothetical protein ABN584_09630 [Gloeocapsa sp. BRSZ]